MTDLAAGRRIEDWPGDDRRRPERSNVTYAVRAPLAAWLKAEAAAASARGGQYRVLDVGCGVKPYLPFFAAGASAYVGVDVVENPMADLTGSVEQLPVEDASFDLVLCTQVLEHCDDPPRAVRELRRVVAPGGRVLASTHGVQVYHPSPGDFWRWTHAGLEKLFRQEADWAAVSVVPSSGTATCVTMVLGFYLELATKRTPLAPLGRAGVAGLNRLGPAVDGRSARLREPGPGTLFANYHVTADAPA
jgi:SAM-dependent methyltransferase